MEFRVVFLQPHDLDERRRVYAALAAEGLDRILFYDVAEPSFEDFEASAGPAAGWCVPVYAGEVLAGVGFVNGFMGRAAFAHFAFLRNWREHAVGIGRLWCREVLATGVVGCLLGFTPAVYRHALAYIRTLGFEVSALRVPEACHLARHGRYVDGIYSRLLPKDLA